MFIEFNSQESVESTRIKSFKPVTGAVSGTSWVDHIEIELNDGTVIVDSRPSSAERDNALNKLRAALDNRKI